MRYNIGEEVSLVSKESPHLNCECVVEDIIGTGYSIGVEGPSGADWWHESALRKRPKPATKSFEEIMKWKVKHG